MKIIKNDYKYGIFYEVDNLDDFSKDINFEEDFEKLNYKKICFIDESYNLLIIELGKSEFFYKFKKNSDYLLLISRKKYYIVNWNGKIMNVLETSADEYEMDMLDKIRKNDVVYFTTQF